MTEERPPCFVKGGYDELFDRVFVQFSDGSIYEYPDFTLEEWVEWLESYPRGTYFNHTYRRSPVPYVRLEVWPGNLSFTF